MSYTPLATEAGSTVTVVYQVCQGTVCNTATVTITVLAGDLDGDGNPDNTDPNPSVPTANGDTVSGAFGGSTTVNILANDDFLANDGNTITQAGGTAQGTVSFDPITGLMSYTPLATEAGSTVTVVYQVCQGTVCNTATVTITVLAVSQPVSDIGTVTSTGGTAILNVAANDKMNGVPATLGTTGNATVSQSGIWPVGITLNPLTGAVTVAAGTVPGVYNVVYELCDKLTPTTCNTATSIITVGESPKIAIIKTATFDDNNGDGYAQAGETITYKFEISNTGNVPLTNVVVIDLLPGIVLTGGPIALGVAQTDTTSFEAKYSLTQADINKGNVENQAKVTALSPIGTLVSDLSDNETITDDKPTVLGISGCIIEVFNAVAPNGSGDNKVFRIRGLECYSDNTVEIYNRWGVLVFERAGYNNDDRAFRGVSEGRVTINQSEELPEGTYYYILRYKDSAATSFEKAGYLYINR
jgi:uncharacterized repeat protein (TIGR01451 family)/gliding motility-associated-like protein